MKTLVVAEKPSVGRDIARVLKCTERGEGFLSGEEYMVTWAIGHLVSLMEPDEMDPGLKKWSQTTLPILPDSIPLKVLPKTRSQFSIVKKLMNSADVEAIICATDAGREGELIFRYIYEMAKCKKPVQRLWINSMTDAAIKEGFDSIRPSAEYDGLYRSARCRSQADWLVGMNASRAYTLHYDCLLSVGRVQTPTLAMLVKRRLEIENFKPEPYATLTADFGDYKGIWFSENLKPDTHFRDKAEAERIAAMVRGKTAVVQSVTVERKKDLPPQLFDLTSLQREANMQLGFTADKTLKLAQSLYENRKALTYPRTDSRYLPPDMIPRVVSTFRKLPNAYQGFVNGALPDGKLPVTRRTIDGGKVTDHHALIPTDKAVDPASFDPDEQKLYDLVVRRTLAAFYPAYEYDATRVITRCEEQTFRSEGQVEVIRGWRAVPALSTPPKRKKEEPAALPPLAKGDVRTVKSASVKEDATKPPFPHNDASLLRAMETAGQELEDEELKQQMKGSGIGTPATRAAVIERLLQVGYAKRERKYLTATDKGVQLISVLPGELTSPEMTAKWEQGLEKITEGAMDEKRFMDSIRRFSAFLVDHAFHDAPGVQFPEENRRGKGKGKGKASGRMLPCACPLCGKGKVTERDTVFGCSGFREGCGLTIWKDGLTRGGGPQLTEKLLMLLLEKKTVEGSTGTLALKDRQITFTPKDPAAAPVTRSIGGKTKG